MVLSKDFFSIEYNLRKFEQTKNIAYLWVIIQQCTEHKKEMPPTVLEYLNSVSNNLLAHRKGSVGDILQEALQLKNRAELRKPYDLIEIEEKNTEVENLMFENDISQNKALELLSKRGIEDKHYITKKKILKNEIQLALEVYHTERNKLAEKIFNFMQQITVDLDITPQYILENINFEEDDHTVLKNTLIECQKILEKKHNKNNLF